MRTSTRAPGFHLPDDSTDLYAQAFGSIVLPHQQHTCNIPDHYSKQDVEEMQGKINELLAQVNSQTQQLSLMTGEVAQSQVVNVSIIVEHLTLHFPISGASHGIPPEDRGP